ncbi:CRIB domain-containing protein RIC7-like [Miscanthus floridulus]|uniref:CRIB domain-containing protein RIC7-like n=1 Tax=Miscanthus floridulus TaxID=154761 RepID=UPI0034597C2A
MGTKMKKGILKPFRYISNMMDGKEPEMQIGFPTDVKHVAHIGWDGPGSNNNNNNNAGGAPSWMKDYHSAPLDSSSFRSESGGTAAANPWASQEIVMDGGSSIGDTSFRDTKSEAGGADVGGGDSPPSPGTRRSRRHRSRGSATSSMDVTGAEGAEEKKKEKGKKGTRKNRKKDKSGGDDASATCQDLPAVPKKSNRRKNKSSSEGNGGAAAKDATTAAPEEGAAATTPPAVDDD